MRILHITPDYYPAMGGGELYIKEISERLAWRGHDVTVLAMNSRGLSGGNGDRLKAREVFNRVKVTRLNNTYKLHERLLGMRGAHRLLGLALNRDRLKMLSISPWSLRAFLFTLRAQADVVGVVNWYHGSLAYQTGVARDIRDFVFVGIPLFHTEREWAHSPLFSQILERCDALAVMTEHEKRFVEHRSSQRKAHVVGAGVDPSLFANADARQIRIQYGIGDSPLVGYVGRMSASKGVVTLIEAMRIVWWNDPSVRLLLAGSGLPSSPRCDDEIRRVFAGLSEAERSRIICISRFNDDEKASIFTALDVFAMASVAESFGIAYLEAWMCRKAVIGSRIGSTEYVIHDRVDGALVTPEDPEDLAKSIVRLLSDHEARDRMGRAGHAKTLAHFTWDKVTDKVEYIYKSAHAEKEKVRRRPAGAVA
jgi:glycosyltransferase involved in cell wall biosynthesis